MLVTLSVFEYVILATADLPRDNIFESTINRNF